MTRSRTQPSLQKISNSKGFSRVFFDPGFSVESNAAHSVVKLCAMAMVSLFVMASMTVMLEPEGVRGDDGSDGPGIEVIWDSAPFHSIFTLTEWNGLLYAGGRYDSNIYCSSDGEDWSPTFEETTSWRWETSSVFKGDFYAATLEQTGEEHQVLIYKSTDGETLRKVYETEVSGTYHLPSRRFSIVDGTLYIGIKGTGELLSTADGENWNMAFSSQEYENLNGPVEFNGAYYISAGAEVNGGALFRSTDLQTWERIWTWTDGTEPWHSSAGDMVVHQDELYIATNGNRESTWTEVWRTADGENFARMWYGDYYSLNYAEFAVFGERLLLTHSGRSDEDLGAEIRVLEKDTFRIIHRGDGLTENHLHGRAVFNDALYIGGGNGDWGEGDAILYRITDDDLIPPPPEFEPYVEAAWDTAPFNMIFLTMEFDGFLYAAGRYDERIYRSPNGIDWSPAFPNKTTYAWQNGIAFKDSLYAVSCEGSGERRTTILWRSADGVSLVKVMELEDTTTERPSFGIYRDTLFLGVETYEEGEMRGYLYSSQDGTNWDLIFTTDEGHKFQVFTIFNDAMYFTMSGLYWGGTLFRTYDGENFEITEKWDENLDYGEDGAYGLCVFKDELYVALNRDGEGKCVRVLKSGNGEDFHEVWYCPDEWVNAPKLCVFKGRLYLYMCGKRDYSAGTQIRYFDGIDFKLIHEGEGDEESTLLRYEIFNDALYISGGGGTWNSDNAVVYRIHDPQVLSVTLSQPEVMTGYPITINASYLPDTTFRFRIQDPDESPYINSHLVTETGHSSLHFSLPRDAAVGTWVVNVSVVTDIDEEERWAVRTFDVLQAPSSIPSAGVSINDLAVPATIDRGDPFAVTFTLENHGDSYRSILLGVQLKDRHHGYLNPLLIPLTLTPYEIKSLSINLHIPQSADTGVYTLQGQALNDLPRNGGYVLDFSVREVSVT